MNIKDQLYPMNKKALAVMNSKKLKLCPFCGETAYLDYEPKPFTGSAHGGWYYVYHECKFVGKIKTDGWRTEDDAIRAWNHRYSIIDIIKLKFRSLINKFKNK